MVQPEEEECEAKIILSNPAPIDEESQLHYKPPNAVHLVLSLFKNVRPGSDLTRFKLPPQFNLPKSHLQCFGEIVYCNGVDMLSRCNRGESPLERFVSVVAWSISTVRPAFFGVAPYNPILGETHHVSSRNLNVLLEQVSHHPPVTALHATDDKENIEMIWCQQPVPKFYGTSVEAEVQGKRQLKLLNFGETYVMNSPNLFIRFLPVPSVDWVGNVRIKCQETGLEAELCYRGTSLLGRRSRSVKGKIFESSSSNKLYEIEGHWDRTVNIKDPKNGRVRVIYNAKEALSDLKAPTVKDPRGVWESESGRVWSSVSQGILSREWEKAREAKNEVEERQREVLRERNSRGENWAPKHFTTCYNKEKGWDCSPVHQWVPAAPIIVPHSSFHSIGN